MDNFSNLPLHSRVWIYAANRNMAPSEVAIANESLTKFSAGWKAHDQLLHAQAKVLHNFFVVFMVDESFAEISGCGIDKSVQLIKELQEVLDIGFFDRLNIQLLRQNQVQTMTPQAFEAALSANEIHSSELYFNNLVQTKEAFETQWLKPVSECWAYKRWLAKGQTA